MFKSVERRPVLIFPSKAVRLTLNNHELLSDIISHCGDDDAGLDELLANVPTGRKREDLATLLSLVKVNRSFSECAIPLLYRVVTNIGHLFSHMLPALKDKHSKLIEPLSYSTKLEPRDFARFQLYARHIETLVLTPKCLGINHLMWSLLETSLPSDPPGTGIGKMFPKVRRVILLTQEESPMRLTLQLLPQLTRLSFKLEHRDPGTRVVLAGLEACPARKIRSLRIDRSLKVAHLEQLVNLAPTLTHLAIQLSEDVVPRDLYRLNALTGLEALSICQKEIVDGIAFPLQIATAAAWDSTNPIALGKLRELHVTGTVITLAGAAAFLTPCTDIRTLELNIIGFDKIVASLPLVFTAFAKQCPALRSFVANFASKLEIFSPECIKTMRNSPRANVDRMLEALAALRKLRTLEMKGIPFFDQKISEHVLKMVRNLRRLKNLVFLPQSFSNVPADQLVLPRVLILRQLAKNNPKLESLELHVDATHFISLRDDYVSTHALRSLRVGAGRFGDPPKNTKVRQEVARYLGRVFPSLTELSGTGGTAAAADAGMEASRSAAHVKSWAAVWKLVQNNYDVRKDCDALAELRAKAAEVQRKEEKKLRKLKRIERKKEGAKK